eukprot:gnl/MRDRNA2_/MRDRNA2_80717_c0_seq1.p1 gnl/MRDRNA2_/MRDRNA2_80717_c0~~gnl/MRDRNA2_/MRDRNA2_80717_c0_seq1.p1  ORF type:complete len:410 (+),score=85.59 gnl/MRDRNA2_/MRDRNA2_80717_c0_seq1:170-1399(+)
MPGVGVVTLLAAVVWANDTGDHMCQAHGSGQYCSKGSSKGKTDWAAIAKEAAQAADWGSIAEEAARAADDWGAVDDSAAAGTVARKTSALNELIRRKGDELRNQGIVVLPSREGGLNRAEIDQLLKVTMGFFNQAVENIGKEMQKNPSLVIRFSDCVARRSHRLDLKPPKLWDKECSFIHQGSTFHEVLKRAFKNETFHLTHCGALVARPMVEGWTNNVNQSWHRDTEDVPELSRKWNPFGISVYIQLVKMSENNGATEFLTRSQNTYPNDIETNPKSYRSRILSTAGLQAGDIVLFDARTLHRGMLHTAPSEGLGPLGARPVVQLFFGVENWVDKAPNWGTRPLVAAPRWNKKILKNEGFNPAEVSLGSYLDGYVDDAHLDMQKIDEKRKKELRKLVANEVKTNKLTG